MADGSEKDSETTSEEKRQKSSSGLFWGIALLAIPLAYMLSPFVLIGPIILMGDAVPERVMDILEMFWLPLEYYVESELPGSTVYKAFIDWYLAFFIP